MRLIQFGDITLPDFNARHNFPVPFRSGLISLQGGSFDQDGATTYLESKVISATFWVSPDAGIIDDVIEAIYREADAGSQQLIAKRRNGTLVQATAKLLDASIQEDARVYHTTTATGQVIGGEGYATMNIGFEIEYPYWLDIDDGEALKLSDGNLLNDDVLLNVTINTQLETITSTGHTFTITNNGNAAVFKGLVSLIVSVDNITDLRITNLTTGEVIEFQKTLVPVDIVVYDLLPMTVTFNGGDGYNFVFLGATQLEFLHLEVGANNFQVDGTFSGSASLDFQYAWIRHYVR